MVIDLGLNPVGNYKFVVNVQNKGYANISSTVNSLDFELQTTSISPTSSGTGGE